MNAPSPPSPPATLLAWLRAPRRTELTRALRDRLEHLAAALTTALAVLALSRAVQPLPKTLPSRTSSFEAARVQLALAIARGDIWNRPRVSPEFSQAVERGDLAAMKRLYVEDMPLDGMVVLAAGTGRLDVLRWLSDHRADVHEQEWTTRAPVLVGDAHPEIVSYLLGRGAAEPTLATAAEGGAPNAIDRLLAAYANPNPPEANPIALALGSPYATGATKRRIVDALLAAGTDATRVVQPPAGDVLAAGVGACNAPDVSHTDCLALLDVLAKRGAMATGDAIEAVLSTLATEAPEDILRAVLRAKLAPGATAIALSRVNEPPPASVKILLARGVDWTYRDGETDAPMPLVVAVQHGDLATVRLLLDGGAPADRAYKNGVSPLGEAIDGLSHGGDFANIVEMLVARGADPNRRLPDGRSPLFAAAEAGDTRVISFLLDRGARVNELVLDDTALDAAEAHSNISAARVLHARGGRRARKPY